MIGVELVSEIEAGRRVAEGGTDVTVTELVGVGVIGSTAGSVAVNVGVSRDGAGDKVSVNFVKGVDTGDKSSIKAKVALGVSD